MKASEVLMRYAAGKRDFRGVSLKGQSFQGKDLSGADFSEADIRGTNFTGAILRGANFSGAKAGLQKSWAALLIILSWMLAGISGLGSSLTAYFVLLIFENDSTITGLISLIVLVTFSIVIIRQGIKAAVVLVVAGAFIVLVETGVLAEAAAFVGAFTLVGAGVLAEAAAFALVGTEAGIKAGTGAFAFLFTEAEAGAFAWAIIFSVIFAFVGAFALVGSGVVVFSSVGSEAGGGSGALILALVFSVIFSVALAVVFSVIGGYIGWRAMKGYKRDAWVRSLAIAFAATGGTSFRDSDLTEVNFTEATLKGADLRKAIMTGVCWHRAKGLDRLRPIDLKIDS